MRIRGGSRKLNANGRTLFANGVRRSVMLFEWLSPSMGLTTFLTMTRFGVSNGSVALATTRACRATPNHRLPNAASSGRDESAQRASSFLANENNGKDQCWSATVHLNRFGLAAAAAGSNESRCLPPSTMHRYIIVPIGDIGRADGQRQCHSQTKLPFRCVLARCPPNSPDGCGAGR